MSDKAAALLVVLGGLVGGFGIPALIVACEYRGAPRGLRWLPHAWGKARDGARWALLRTFYPEEVKPAPPPDPDDEVRRLELWHMAYELDRYDIEMVDRISRSPNLYLYDDTLRQWKAKQARKEEA